MRLLLIHPADFDLNPILALCGKHEVDTVPAGTANFGLRNGVIPYQTLVLVGNQTAQTANTVAVLRDVLQGELSSAAGKDGRASLLPVIGLGWGFTVVCAALGEDLQDIAEHAQAATTLRPTDDGARLFQGTEPMKINDGPRWIIDQLPRSLRVLAESDSGIEAVKHTSIPLLALQVLPQDFVYPSDGRLVFENALSIAARA